MLGAVPGAVSGWQHGAGYVDRGEYQPGLLLRCARGTTGRPRLAGNNLSQQVTLTGTRLTVVVGTSKATGDFTPIAFLGVTQVSGSPNFTISASPASLSVAARQSGDLDDHDDHQRWLQQRDQSVGFRSAVGDDGELQSQPDTGAGCGQLDHDHHGGLAARRRELTPSR